LSLETYGWNEFFAASFAPYKRQGYVAGRVFLQHNKIYMLYTEEGEMSAEVSGRVLHEAASRDELPAVGDWVAIRVRREEKKTKATIHAVLPRRSKFSRKVAGSKTDEQVVAANIDTLFLVTGLDNDFNVRRIERYLLMASESGARPVVVLNKSDVAEDALEKVKEVERVALDVPIVLMSAREGGGIEALLPYVGAGQTVSLMGSSGVGKSTITNKLLGAETQKVQEVRAGDERGKHTTTHRELIRLPTGGLIIDTPGMRELQLLVRDRGLRDTFEDVEALGEQCYFRDCKHEGEPDCAVKAALESGELDTERYANYRKMQHEMSELAAKQRRRTTANAEQAAALAAREKTKKIHQALKKHYKNREREE
jgi:ribosome biogenesis GTPase